MSGSVLDNSGVRKYLTARERFAFARAAYNEGGEVATFCLTLAFSGARISELLAMTPERVDAHNGWIVLETLKRRKRGVYRVIPLPSKLITMLQHVHALEEAACDPKRRLWSWGRTTAWKRVKLVMRRAKIPERLTMPKSARHAFGVDAVQNKVALNVVQRWMGHARIETTAIYAEAMGREERALARRTWNGLQKAISD